MSKKTKAYNREMNPRPELKLKNCWIGTNGYAPSPLKVAQYHRRISNAKGDSKSNPLR